MFIVIVEDDNGIENVIIIYIWYVDDVEIEGEVFFIFMLEEV